MPAKYSRKQFQADGYYHLYNRGVEKRAIFRSERDYRVLLSYLATYLLPKDTVALQQALAAADLSSKERDSLLKQLRLKNFADTIEIVAFCLMPNHFHFLARQKTVSAIDQFMSALWTRYTMYFNKTYHRVGPLFQGVYKAVPVETDEQLLHLSRYIHTNPYSLSGKSLRTYRYSSYPEYLNMRKSSWINSQGVLSFFSKKDLNNYESFVEDKTTTIDSHLLITLLTIDHEM